MTQFSVYANAEHIDSVRHTLFQFCHADAEFFEAYALRIRVRDRDENPYDEQDSAIFKKVKHQLPSLSQVGPVRVIVSPLWGCTEAYVGKTEEHVREWQRQELFDDVVFADTSSLYNHIVWEPFPSACLKGHRGRRYPQIDFHAQLLSEVVLRREAKVSGADAAAITRKRLVHVDNIFTRVLNEMGRPTPADCLVCLMAAIVLQRHIRVANEVIDWYPSRSMATALKHHAFHAQRVMGNMLEYLEDFNIIRVDDAQLLLDTQDMAEYDSLSRRLLKEWQEYACIQRR